MPSKTFHSRRQWHNTFLMLWMAPFLILSGVLFLVWRNDVIGLYIAGGVLIAGSIIAIVRDGSETCTYSIKGGHIRFDRHSGRLSIPISLISDVSLIDRLAAREYIKSSTGTDDNVTKKNKYRDYLQYCTVDIGLTSLTLGIGRTVTDRLPHARYDLVLIRLKDGRAYLISPRYNHDLVETVNRLITASDQ